MHILISRLDQFWVIKFDEKSWNFNLDLISSFLMIIKKIISLVLICNFSANFHSFLARNLAFLWDCLWNEVKFSSLGLNISWEISEIRKKLTGFFDLI